MGDAASRGAAGAAAAGPATGVARAGAGVGAGVGRRLGGGASEAPGAAARSPSRHSDMWGREPAADPRLASASRATACGSWPAGTVRVVCEPANRRTASNPNLYTSTATDLSLIHISEPTRRTPISYAVFCLK